jgi:pilus assembly protein CpaF
MAVDVDLVRQLRLVVADRLAPSGIGPLSLEDRRALARDVLAQELRRRALDAVAGGAPAPPVDDERAVIAAVLDALFGLGRLQALVDDPSVENIDVNGCDVVWVTTCDGTKRRVDPIADSDDELVALIRHAAAHFGMAERRFDMAHPELDLRLPDGSRLSALMAVAQRPVLSIRRHRYLDLTLDELVALGTVERPVADLLAAAVRARKNIVVGGAMNAGKTTLLRALAAEIPPWERIVTIEQALELCLDANPDRHPDLVALEERQANAEGEGAFSMARLVRRALRMNADRVIVGEVLGDEVLPMLNAMSQGRAGSMCTIHADSSHGVFRRIASYAVQSPQRLPLEATNLLVAGAVDLVVFVDVRTASSPGGALGAGAVDGDEPLAAAPALRRRTVASILEVVDADGPHVVTNEVVRPGPDGRPALAAPLRSRTLRDLEAVGYRHPQAGQWELVR